jgi:PKD repeat protein
MKLRSPAFALPVAVTPLLHQNKRITLKANNMKILKTTLALLTAFTLNYSHAQTTGSYPDSSLELNIRIVNNSNMGYQVPTEYDVLFLADTMNTSSLIAVAGNQISSTFVFDPNICAFPFVTDSSTHTPRPITIEPLLDHFYSLNLGVRTSIPATISITASFNALPMGNYVAFLKRLSTGDIYPILNDTATMTVPPNTNFSTDFILLVGPAVHKTAMNQTCYNDGNGGVNVICAAAAWDYKIYNNSNNLIRQHNVVSAIDTTIDHLQQGNYTVKTFINHITVDSGAFVVNGPAQIIPAFTISDYAPLTDAAVNFTDNSAGASSVSWDFGDSFTDSIGTPSHTYTTPGVYVITLTAQNGACFETTTDSLEVFAPSVAPHFSNNLPHNNNAPQFSNDEPAASSRLASAPEISVATDMHKLTISGSEETNNMTVEVLNMNGQLISTIKSNTNSVQTSVENSGIYMIRVSFENGSVVTKSIMIL